MAVCMEGPLSKWTNVMKGWQYRWFVLDDNAGLLSYYTSKEKMIRGARRGCVRLQDAIIGIDDEEDSTFTITVDQKIFHFQARDSEERKQWVCSLEDTILRHNQRKCNAPFTASSLSDFDRRLAEADAYLQLLIENVKGIEAKISSMDSNVGGKEDLEEVLFTAQEMIEAVKKSIVLLQMAKRSVSVNFTSSEQLVVVQKLVGDPGRSLDDDKTTASSPNIPTSTDAQLKVAAESASGVKSHPNLILPNEDNVSRNSTEESHEAVPSSSVDEDPTKLPPIEQSPSPAPVMKLLDPARLEIPSTSYSSSEDECDEFFDASEGSSVDGPSRPSASVEEPLSQETEQKIPETKASDEVPELVVDISTPDVENVVQIDENVPVTSEIVEKTDEDTQKPTSKEKEDSTIKEDNMDHMYMHEESYEEKEGESLEEHKSVIMHLLSQVKLGMDLTKVVLPTFILEKRSLLEMYADFFSHADYFLQIAQKPTPQERMIACVRFYLSTFSAGRNSSVAKKPYNPILGEFFQCFWKHRNFPTVTDPPVAMTEGPVPWAKSNQLAFIAEQVSHHPPVSAFYAEHKDQRIQFNGHIWTKSKFLGLSVGVHNIGQGCVRLLDLDEEYILTFPNGYGRSILTVPWFELGGDCTITCEKTGFNAIVKFHTKPFYGGKIHKVTGEIYQPNVKKPLCTLEGEWNTVIFCNHQSGKSERFVDAKRPKKTKIVRKIEYQEPTESRSLWQDVTTDLKGNKIDQATEAKRSLEDKQRSDAKMRLENNIVYTPKFFHADDCQNWIYNNPLSDRTA